MNEQTNVAPKCPQCGKEMSSPVTRRIIFRDFNHVTRKQFVNEKDRQFCSETCGAHYQMGCEG